LAEDGPIHKKYPLLELESPDYRVRTKQNLLDAQATAIIYHKLISGGTKLTQRLCHQHHRPHILIDASQQNPHQAAHDLHQFCNDHFITALNVAGPRMSSWKDGYKYTYEAISLFTKNYVDDKVHPLT
jgi:hypothetical protein